MAEFVAPKIECPFYISGAAQHIVCESALTSKGSAKHFFRSKKQKEKFVTENCCKNQGEGCVYYNCIMLRYEKEEAKSKNDNGGSL